MRIRTGFSFRMAFGQPEDVLDRLQKIGYGRAPISDHFSTFGWVTWDKLCRKADVKPLFGVELSVTPAPDAKKPPTDNWTFYPIDDIKYVNYTVGDTRKGLLSYEQAKRAKGVIKIAGERALLDCFEPAPDIFVALTPASPKGLVAEAAARGFHFVASSDNYYPSEDDKEVYRVLLGKRSSTQTYPLHILSDAEWHKAVEYIASDTLRAQAIESRNKLFSTCFAPLKRATLLTPDKPKTLRAMCVEGAQKKNVNLADPVYAARLDRELAMIDEKKFEDYFYIIADLVAFAKKNMVVGPARGSSCGSLVCYLLDITAIDPIPFNLLFERFIDINRADLPDIDLDFSDKQRDQVFVYAREKYGKDHVARLGTVSTFQPKSIFKQAGFALKIPVWKVEALLSNLIVRSSGDARANQTIADTLVETEAGRGILKDFPEIEVVAKAEGHPNNSSQHAAGIVVTQDPVEDYIAIDKRTYATMCDKYDAEALNLLKIDALGLTQLSVFERTLELIGKKPVSGFLETVPLDDPAAFEVLNKQHFAGIFQFMGHALQSLARVVNRIEHIEDIIALTALARPGPMATGNATLWAKRRNGGPNTVTYPHDAFKPFLEGSLGIVIYQEQVMQIGRELGDLTWEDVTQLRKAMSKSLGKEFFNQYGDRWKAGAAKRGIPVEILDKVWDDLCAYGSWSFNRSHAVAYGIVSYWCCWLKAHHPLEYAAATLDAEFDEEKQRTLLLELAREGIEYKPVDAEVSTAQWTIKDGKLVGPLTAIKGVGPKTVLDVFGHRKTGKPLKPSVQKLLDDPKTGIDTLFPIRDATPPEVLGAAKVYTAPTDIRELRDGQRAVLVGILKRIRPRDENDAQSIAKRGGKVFQGPTTALYLVVKDDSDEILCKIDRFTFKRLLDDHKALINGETEEQRSKSQGKRDYGADNTGKAQRLSAPQAENNEGRTETMYDHTRIVLQDHSYVDKAIFAVAGYMGRGFRMFNIENVRFIRDI